MIVQSSRLLNGAQKRHNESFALGRLFKQKQIRTPSLKILLISVASVHVALDRMSLLQEKCAPSLSFDEKDLYPEECTWEDHDVFHLPLPKSDAHSRIYAQIKARSVMSQIILQR